MRLVDADKTIGHIKTRLLETALNNCDVVCDASYLYQDCADNRIETWVDEMPAVDAVPVVRCKDCIHYYADPWGYGNCMFEDGVSRRTKTSDFCSWGERREDET